MREKAKKDPAKYIGWDCDTIYWGQFDNQQVVYDCPCNKAKKYEDLIWKNRYVIIKYLKKRMEENFEVAKMEKEMIEGIELK